MIHLGRCRELGIVLRLLEPKELLFRLPADYATLDGIVGATVEVMVRRTEEFGGVEVLSTSWQSEC